MPDEPEDGYAAHMLSTGSIYIPDPVLEQLKEDMRQLKLAFDREEERFSKLTPQEQHFENLMHARYGGRRF